MSDGTGQIESAPMPVPQPSAPAVPVTPAVPTAPVAPRSPRLLERMLAAVSHLLMLLSIPGLVVAALIWVTQRRHSPYVAAHARAAVVWQVVSNAVFMLLLGVLLLIAVTSLGGAVTSQGTSGEGAVTRLVGSLLGLYVVLVAAALFFGISALLGALFALFGRTFHYPLVGRARK